MAEHMSDILQHQPVMVVSSEIINGNGTGKRSLTGGFFLSHSVQRLFVCNFFVSSVRE